MFSRRKVRYWFFSYMSTYQTTNDLSCKLIYNYFTRNSTILLQDSNLQHLTPTNKYSIIKDWKHLFMICLLIHLAFYFVWEFLTILVFSISEKRKNLQFIENIVQITQGVNKIAFLFIWKKKKLQSTKWAVFYVMCMIEIFFDNSRMRIIGIGNCFTTT